MWERLVFIAFFLIVGGVPFLLRKKWRRLYGVTELTFAIFSGWRVLGTIKPDEAVRWPTLIAALYLVVRG